MTLPESVRQCVRALETAGFAAYLVGGCVRDDRMGIPPHDFDLCTDAVPEQTAALFAGYPLDMTGGKHGTVRVLLADRTVEITTFRQEGAYHDSRRPDWVTFVPDLRQDLARRDFTVNAVAWSPTRGYCDPFGGLEDADRRLLRCVGNPEERFREDPLRILRGIRFAARFSLEVEKETLSAMVRLAPLTDLLARERVFEELTGFLLRAGAEDILRFAPVLTAVIPELAPAIGFDQHSPHHAYDIFTHTARVTAAVPEEPVLRWAALLHDIGKVSCFRQDPDGRGHFTGHAGVGARMAEGILRRLRAPKALREEAAVLIAWHMPESDEDLPTLRRCLSRFGREMLEQLLALQEADLNSKGIPEEADPDRFPRLRRRLRELDETEGRITLRTLAISGNDLAALGLSGPALGRTLNRLLELVLDGCLPNETDALRHAAADMKNPKA